MIEFKTGALLSATYGCTESVEFSPSAVPCAYAPSGILSTNELLLGTSQNRTDYLQTEVQQKLTLCTPAQRRLVNRFIDLLLEEAQPQQ